MVVLHTKSLVRLPDVRSFTHKLSFLSFLINVLKLRVDILNILSDCKILTFCCCCCLNYVIYCVCWNVFDCTESAR